MSDTSLAVARKERAGDVVKLPLASTAATYKKGHLIEVNSGGYGAMGGDDASVLFGGIANQEVEVESGGSNGAEEIQVAQKGLFLMTFTSTLTQADLLKAAYAADNYRAARYADVSNRLFVGIIKAIVSASQAWVDIEPAIPNKATLANAIS
jgi:hypothetical protein